MHGVSERTWRVKQEESRERAAGCKEYGERVKENEDMDRRKGSRGRVKGGVRRNIKLC